MLALKENALEPAAREEKSPFLESIFEARKTLEQKIDPWNAERKAGFERFIELGIPTTKNEDWKYTSLQPLARASFTPAPAAPKSLPSQSSIQRFLIPVSGASVLTFVDGHFAPSLSSVQTQSGIEVGSLKDALPGSPLADAITGRLGTGEAFREQSFLALNSGLFRDGAVIRVKKGSRIESPIQLLFVASESSESRLQALRNLIVVEENAEVRIVETYAGLGAEPYFTLPVTEVFCGANAIVDHTKIQHEADAAFHIGALTVEQANASRFSSHLFNFGGGLVRNEIYPVLNGENIECLLNGLTVIQEEQHTDNFTVLDHAKPNSFSRELYKGIYADRSSGAFSGTIIVRKDAQKTNAIQSNQTLLLSDEASVDTRPQLKIWADDVKCTHGATIGQLDEQGLFYLRSRGIPKAEARNILIHAFASDVIQYVPFEELRDQLEGWLMARLDEIGSV